MKVLVPLALLSLLAVGRSDEPLLAKDSNITSLYETDTGKLDDSRTKAVLRGTVVALTPENTTIQFVGAHVGNDPNPHTGHFGEFSGSIELGADASVEAISLDIETGSLTTEIRRLTNHLKSPDFFDVREHPQASFRSTSIESNDDGTITVTGELTLVGVTREIRFPATVEVGDDGVQFASEFQINRTHFGMTFGLDKVEEMVSMTVTVTQ